MQTPGNTIQPQTPMVPMERKLNNAYNALIRRSEENLQVERGPQARQFGRIMLQFEQLNNNMEVIQAEIRRDIRARRKFFEAEQKLMKKDSDNLDNIRAGAFFELRRDIALIASLAGARDLSEGNFGDATSNFGVALTSMIPEIAMGVAALLGLGAGARGGGTSPIAGGGRMRGLGGKGGLLTIAALAAMLLMGGKSQADERRKTSVLSTTESPAVNVSDSERFRSQLDRFDSILDNFGVASPEGEKRGLIDIREKQDPVKLDANKNVLRDLQKQRNEITNSPPPFEPKIETGQEVVEEKKDDQLTSQLGSISKELAFVSETNDDRWMNFMNANRGIEVATTDLQGLNIGKVFDTSSNADDRRLSELDTQLDGEDNQSNLYTTLESKNNIAKLESVFDKNFGIDNLSSQEVDRKSWLDWRPPNPFAGINFGGDKKEKNEKQPIVIENDNGTTTQKTAPIPEGTGPSASPDVHTTFMRGGGAIDKFDYSLSLKTYVALGGG